MLSSIQFTPGPEQCECTRCEAVIPRHMIFTNIVRTDRIEPTRQRVRAFCVHCNTLFQTFRVLRGGEWGPVGKVEIITDPTSRTAFLNQIADVRGDVQRAAC